ncbi:MAG: hypothetical protein WCD82_01355, partial [Xanthobacteraceae bacterium]
GDDWGDYNFADRDEPETVRNHFATDQETLGPYVGDGAEIRWPTPTRCPLWVKSGKTHPEKVFSRCR